MLHLLHWCVSLGIPVVSSVGAAARLDPTAIRMEDLCETHRDPFANDIRKLLKRKYGVPTEPLPVRQVRGRHHPQAALRPHLPPPVPTLLRPHGARGREPPRP